MQELKIEWRHLDVDGKTCDRCAATEVELRQFVHGLQDECANQDVHIKLREVNLSVKEIEESNRIFINGTPLEEIISETSVSQNECPSCSDLIGNLTCCRTIIHSARSMKPFLKN